jgi:DNA-binding IscR family transcriptional regulator
MAGSANSNPVHVRRVLGGLRDAGLVAGADLHALSRGA